MIKAKCDLLNITEQNVHIRFVKDVQTIAPVGGMPGMTTAGTAIEIKTVDPKLMEFYSAFRPGKEYEIEIKEPK